MKTNNRLVLIDNRAKTYTVYEGKVALATYHEDGTDALITKEVVEEIRVANYDSKA